MKSISVYIPEVGDLEGEKFLTWISEKIMPLNPTISVNPVVLDDGTEDTYFPVYAKEYRDDYPGKVIGRGRIDNDVDPPEMLIELFNPDVRKLFGDMTYGLTITEREY